MINNDKYICIITSPENDYKNLCQIVPIRNLDKKKCYR